MRCRALACDYDYDGILVWDGRVDGARVPRWREKILATDVRSRNATEPVLARSQSR